MPFLSQAPPLGSLSRPHGAFQEQAAHAVEWSTTLSSKGSSGTCIPEGVSTFFHAAYTAHRAEAIGRRPQCEVRCSAWTRTPAWSRHHFQRRAVRQAVHVEI